jgi:N,N'-diacetylbacillosaminyl-diphospho-undecaprenol alpha-1,3-N-acetylgalactosaminyltransferase
MARLLFLSHYDFNLYRFRLPVMKAAVEQGYEVIAASPPGPYAGEFAAHGIRHAAYSLVRQSVNPWREAASLLSLWRLFRRTAPDLLHTFTVKPNIYGSLAAAAVGTRVIINSVTGLGSWHSDDSGGWKAGFSSALYALALQRSAAVIFYNTADRDEFERRHIVGPDQSVLIRGSGVDESVFQPVDRRGRSVVTVCMVARLIRDKGVAEYLDAARRIRGQWGDRVRFWLVGETDPGNPGGLSPDWVAGRAGSAVELLGHREDIPAILAASDIYCLPSYREGLPMSVLEAMASGLPIVTTNAVGCRETVEEGVNGFQVAVRDPEGLAAAIERLLREPELRRSFGEASRRRAVSEFSVRRVVSDHLRLYSDLLAKWA